MEYFVACAPGLEGMLLDEIAPLSPESTDVVAGGVAVQADEDFVYRANLRLGVAHSVRLRLGDFIAKRFDVLVKRIAALPWTTQLTGAVRIDVTTKRSRLYHTGAIEERVLAGIRKALGHEPTGETTTTVHIRIVHDRCTVSVDTSGEPLVRRGYRRGTGKAPLRADLARAMVKLSGWTPEIPLVDPFCGSGTIVIEAALLGTGRAPGDNRTFAFEHAPWFDPDRLAQARAVEPRTVALQIHGSDRDEGVVKVAKDNAARAGVEISVVHAAVSDAPGLMLDVPCAAVVSNPPYGHRVSKGRDLRPLFQRLGARLAAHPKWAVALLSSDVRLAHHTGLGLKEAACFDHGGTRVRVMARPV